MNNVVINNNKALIGAGICSNGAMFIYTSIIKNNTAIEDGGGIWNKAVLDLVNSTITITKPK